MADTKTMKVNNAEKQGFLVRPIGSILGFIYTLIIGFGLYFVLNSFKNVGNWFPYSKVIEKVAEGDILY